MADEFSADPEVVVVLIGEHPDEAAAEGFSTRFHALQDRMPDQTVFVIATADPEMGELQQAALAPAEGPDVIDVHWVDTGGELLELGAGEPTQIHIARDGQVSIGDAEPGGVVWRAAKALTISFDWGDHRPPGTSPPPAGRARFRCPVDDVFVTVDIGAPAACPVDPLHPIVPA